VAILTLTSDFGLHDPYVGIMKSRILQRAPQLQLVDLTHDIAPFAIEAAGYWLYCVQPQFPAGTVHLAVVDPGVGSERAIVVLEAHPPVDAQGQSFEPDVDQFADLLRTAVGDSTVAIHWDYAREVLQKSDGVLATVGLEADLSN